MIHDLRDAGVFVVEHAVNVQSEDSVIILDTPAYRQAYQASAHPLIADIPLVQARLGNRALISLMLTGNTGAHEFKDCTPGNFCDPSHYPVSLLDLVLNLYTIPLDHVGFAPLRQALHEQWEQTAERLAHADETTLPVPPPALPAKLLTRCRKTFLACREFDSDANLRAVFLTTELKPFQDAIPQAENKTARVGSCLAYLMERQLENGCWILPIFVVELSRQYSASDAQHHNLLKLAKALDQLARGG